MPIVKVQASQFSSYGERRLFVYDEHKTFQWEGPASLDVMTLLKGRAKAYFNADLIPAPNNKKNKIIQIKDEVEAQPW